jgi:hypothetical protein
MNVSNREVIGLVVLAVKLAAKLAELGVSAEEINSMVPSDVQALLGEGEVFWEGQDTTD